MVYLTSSLCSKLTCSYVFTDVHQVPVRSESREDPGQYVDEVKQILGDEKGLNPRSRDLVTDIINRLAEQVQTAESSRDLVVRELVVLRERLQVKQL